MKSSPRTARWQDRYEVQLYHGQEFPAPGDWEMNHADMDVTSWQRPPYPEDPDDPYWDEHETYDPEDEAHTLVDWGPGDEQTIKFDVNGEPVFTVENPERDELLAAIAEVLQRVIDGEDYHDVDPPESQRREGQPQRGHDSASLGDYGGSA